MTGSDGDLIAASWQRPEAFGTLFERHFTAVHRYLARRAGTQAADDLASEVFTTAFRRRRTFRAEHDSALPWLYGIAANVLRSHLRSASRQAAVPPGPEPVEPPFVDAVEDAVDAHRRFAVLREHLDALSEDDRATLLLHAWEDLPYEQVAQALDIPVGTVRSRLNRVRRKLRSASTAP